MDGDQCPCDDDAVVILDEVVVEILSWVPVKALMRFRCVSKSWNSLILDPTFVKLHLQRSSRDSPALFTLSNLFLDKLCSLHCCSIDGLLEDPSSTIDVNADANDDNGGTGIPANIKYSIIGVCNGLICLRDMSRGFEVARVQFWNPATRLISVTSPPIPPFFGCARMGFGYDESSDTYKVVAIVGNRKSRKMELRVHCLGDNCWKRKIECGNDILPSDTFHGKGQFLSGTLNWVANLATLESYVVFSFDLRNETYRYLLPPVRVRFGLPEVRVLRGCLCFSHNEDGTHLAIWQMKKFGVQKSWTLLIKVSYKHFEFCRSYFPHPLCMSANNDVLLLGNNSKYQLVLCNLKNNTISNIELPLREVFFISFDYVQSLVLPYRN
ncbi:hypothetical protein AAZX31_06G172700 [Glycine max]|uniref:F-box domain-containing protein n=1 Tax=Glycine max TaxID=3847 RepID=K7KVR9_SOYBN|nr:F-box/kelch-repeat protein At3g23880 [Glycine max]KAG5046239.1 hypothetical protein JHK86_015645 [Glycine max]KAH1126517.1 hypothetical protein GYH30_015488 [Glycine max]KAH1246214.1 F-box/kelch-repeat protein [Glycine max]KRH54377.1 hypothetical protein GLYMA_06G181300v4 [Glycine max]|eukprot:XP_006582523.1 F-box/kelch-repeat protein At3g23880 [Glycine max]